MELYDTIGRGYDQLRRPDSRLAAEILRALGASSSVVNVGAGAGSYEPRDRSVVAVEPSTVMIRQREPGLAPPVQAMAHALPFRDESFDASLAILTVHHWVNYERGIQELRRVARSKTVILTWDPSAPGFWLADYFPEILEIDRQVFPSLTALGGILGSRTVRDILIPHDCSDGFLGAYWRRPAEYLRSDVRSAISTFAKLRDTETGLACLLKDLESGQWHRRYGKVLDRTELDLGYRLIVA